MGTRRFGLIWILLSGCISLGDYRSASVLPEGTWEMGAGSPLVLVRVDTSGVDGSPGLYPEVFARYGLSRNLEVEGRAVVIFPFTGALGGGVRWRLWDSGWITTLGLHGMVFLLRDQASSFTMISLYPGIWMGKGKIRASARLMWVLASINEDTTRWTDWATTGVLLTVGTREAANTVVRFYPELSLLYPFSASFFWVLLGLGVSFQAP